MDSPASASLTPTGTQPERKSPGSDLSSPSTPTAPPLSPGSNHAIGYRRGMDNRSGGQSATFVFQGRREVETRGAGGAGSRGVTSALPLSTSAAALGRGRRTRPRPYPSQLSSIPSDSSTIYEGHPSGSTPSRKLSASFKTDGSLYGEPTTGYSSVTATTEPPDKRPDTTATGMTRVDNGGHQNAPTDELTVASPLTAASESRESFDRWSTGPRRQPNRFNNLSRPSVPSSSRTNSPHLSRSNLPVPQASFGTPSASTANLSRFKAENIPPSSSASDLGAKARDSLQLPSTLNLPKRRTPIAKLKNSPELTDLSISESPRRVPDAQQQKASPSKLPGSSWPRSDSLAKLSPSRLPRLDTLAELSSKLPPPSNVPTPQSKATKKPSGLPKSRTFNVFSNLAASLSRPSLGSFGRGDSRKPSASSTMATPTRTSADGSAQGSSRASIAHDATSTTGSASGPHVTFVEPPRRNPKFVYEKKSATYWIGRFVGMQDKLRNEMLTARNLNIMATATAQRLPESNTNTSQNEAALPTSFTTANISSIARIEDQTDGQKLDDKMSPATVADMAAILTDSDHRIRRAFICLEALCITKDALDSLHEFQQDYARKVGKPHLLPLGGTMEEPPLRRGLLDRVGRVFSNGSGDRIRGILGQVSRSPQ